MRRLISISVNYMLGNDTFHTQLYKKLSAFPCGRTQHVIVRHMHSRIVSMIQSVLNSDSCMRYHTLVLRGETLNYVTVATDDF